MGGSYRLKQSRNAKFRNIYLRRNSRGLLSKNAGRTGRPLSKQRSPFAAYPSVNWSDAVDNKRATPFDPINYQWKKIKKEFPSYGTHKRKVGQLEDRGEKFFRRHSRLVKGLTSAGGYGIEPAIGLLVDKIIGPAYQTRKKMRSGGL